MFIDPDSVMVYKHMQRKTLANTQPSWLQKLGQILTYM